MAKKIIFAFAHQDDEILISGKIMHEIDSGTDVHLLWCNDGSGGTGLYADKESMKEDYAPHMRPGETLDSLTPERVKEILCVVREAEARNAMRSIGVPDKNMHFLKHPADWMKKPGNIAAMTGEIEKLLNDIKPDEVYADAWEAAHISHDISHFAAVQAARRISGSDPRIFEFPQYPFLSSYKNSILKHFKKSKFTGTVIHLIHYGIGQFAYSDGKVESLKLDDKRIEIKSGLMKFYTSQSKLTKDFDSIIKARAAIATFIPRLRHKPDVEMWRRVPENRDYRIPPCRGHRYSEYNQGITDADYTRIFSEALELLK